MKGNIKEMKETVKKNMEEMFGKKLGKNVKMVNYGFQIDLKRVVDAAQRRAGESTLEIKPGDLRSVARRIELTLEPLGCQAYFEGGGWLYITLILPRSPIGYLWLGRDLSTLMIAGILVRLFRNRRNFVILWRGVFKKVPALLLEVVEEVLLSFDLVNAANRGYVYHY